ncbi:MAG TPA: alpha/beta hydrolase-fold protein [Ruminiclostridium sp.]|nr:alpha/beta hydrolase-fold protein [Ruminiclostridium sp.]
MALVQMDFLSKSLSGTTGFNLVLPNDTYPEMLVGNKCYDRTMKTLYLLHGYSGTNKDWLLGSSVAEMALKYNLAIVMPAGGNSFYLDGKGTGKAYSQYVGKELVDYTRSVFGLSDKKEDTFIGGYSMGGFGAIHTGLAFPETFSKVIALSSALIVHGIKNKKEDFKNAIADYFYYTSVFGDLDKLDTSLNNPEYQIHKMKEEGKAIPPIYMACGTEDFLINENRAFHQFLTEENVDVTYVESQGVHNWTFWNEYLEPAIQWMLF